MKKNLLNLGIIASILILVACNQKSRTYMEDGHLTVELPLNALGISQDSALLDSARYTPLETTPASVISSIDKIYYTDTSIIIGDFRQSSVFVFGLKGNYIKKMEQRGQGPGEYQNISDMDYRNHQLTIWDFSIRKMLTYDENFHLLKEKVILPPYNTNSYFVPLGNRLVFKMEQGLGLSNSYQLAVMDTTGYKIVDSLLSPKKYSYNHNLPTAFNLVSNDSMAYYQPYGDNYVYQLSSSDFKLDTLCKLYIPQKYLIAHYNMGTDFKEENTQKFILEKGIVCVDLMQQTGDVLYLSYYFKSERYHVLLNIKTNNYKFFTTHPGQNLNPHFLETSIGGSFDGGLIGFILPADFDLLKTWGKMTIEKESNPVVAKFYFKKAALQ